MWQRRRKSWTDTRARSRRQSAERMNCQASKALPGSTQPRTKTNRHNKTNQTPRNCTNGHSHRHHSRSHHRHTHRATYPAMTREEAQDEALQMCAEWTAMANQIDTDRTYTMTGKQLRTLCTLMATIADSAAQIAERIPMEILEGK